MKGIHPQGRGAQMRLGCPSCRQEHMKSNCGHVGCQLGSSVKLSSSHSSIARYTGESASDHPEANHVLCSTY